MTEREHGASPSGPPTSTAFLPTDRYEVRRSLGQGGMGVVYEAFDRETQQLVALKTVQRFSPSALYQFKREFRALADVSHPNLVRLFELVVPDGGQVFFTMELVRGVDFVTHVVGARGISSGRMRRAAATAPEQRLLREVRAPRVRVSSYPPAGSAKRPSRADFDRLRPTLRQLVEGVAALHAAGKLHRDIKPSNVLVTPEGRVVLLDFGLATEIGQWLGEQEEDESIVGTAAYMSPEQATGEKPGPPSDWYSVGVMLYEALVGQPPFLGSSMDVRTRKSLMDVRSPSSRAEGIPEDLEVLCMALLRREPGSRPNGVEILRWLAGASTRGAPRSPLPPDPADASAPLVGRAAQLALLEQAFESAQRGQLVTVCLHGHSGMGKSALATALVDQLADSDRAVVLCGRAYERESMPYKALDSIIDAISHRLVEAGEKGALPKLPDDIGALACQFPVLRRVDAIADAPEPDDIPLHILWRRALAALRELLARLADTKPLVLFIDDVQWGDVDSARLLGELVQPPFESRIMLLLTYRDEEVDSNPFLVEMRTKWPQRTDLRDLALTPLGEEEGCALALSFLGPRAGTDQDLARSIARESRGSPLLIEELARHARWPAGSDSASEGKLRLEDVLEKRIALLPNEARRMVELLAVCARPLPVSILGDAASASDRLGETIAALCARRLVRRGFRAGRDTAEILHDRVREAIIARLPVEVVRAHHGRLARVLEALPMADPEALAMHLYGAGDVRRAGKHAERAAENAVAKLAFAEAMRLYTMALEAVPPDSADARRLRLCMASLLERTGRGVDAANAYRAAAKYTAGRERVELEREAAKQLLTAGRLKEGAAALDGVLKSAGLRAPRSVLGAVLSLLTYRIVLRLRGLHFRPRDPVDVPRIDHLRIEALYAFVIGINIVNVIYGTCMQARHLLLTLRAGSRLQLLRAVALEAGNVAAMGGPEGPYERALWAIVDRLVDESHGDVDSRALRDGVRGVAEFFRGRWKQGRSLLVSAMDTAPRTPAGWHVNAVLFSIYSLTFLGDLRALRTQLPARLAEAEERGDLYTTVNLRIGHLSLCWLVSDEVDVARTHLREAMAAWSLTGFSLQHYRAMLAEAQIELYAGNAEGAYSAVARDWRALGRSLLMRVQYVRIDAYALRARCAVASLATAPNRSHRLAEAERLARKLDGEDMSWSRPMAALLWAAIANARGDRQQTVARLRETIESAQEADMALYSAVARLRLGSMLGGAEGERTVAEAYEWMRAQEIRVPERIAAIVAPGFVPMDDADAGSQRNLELQLDHERRPEE